MSRVVHIGDDVGRLQVRDRQLRAYHRESQKLVGTAPLEDVDIVLADSTRGLVFDTHALQAMLADGTTLVVCDRKHMPVGMVLPLAGAWNHTHILHAQIEMSEPRRKRAWQQIVQSKIRAQARNLPEDDPVAIRLTRLVAEVRSGDTGNVEATAARSYWPALLGQAFRRANRTRAGDNGALDYGYAVLRSLVARSAVGAGLHPALGLHHIGRSNPYCLVDDLIEPLRPVIDLLVLEHNTEASLSSQMRAILAGVVETPFAIGDRTGPLTIVMGIYAANVRQYILGEVDKIEMPTVAYDTST